jgi:hypothetical protein
MEDKYAILNSDNEVINVVVWNGDTTIWQPPQGTIAMPLSQVSSTAFITDKYTGEEWITKSGYTATRLISLLDLEMKLFQTNKTSDKMVAVRQWLNNLLQAVAVDTTSHLVWPEAPYSYEDTIQDALTVLAS